jgi:hypothetical protein
MAVQQLSPEVSGATTGALTRELLTGTTYAARTEGSGYWRDVQAEDLPYPPASVPLSAAINGPTTGTVARELLTGTTYAARTEGSGYWRIVTAAWDGLQLNVPSVAEYQGALGLLQQYTSTSTIIPGLSGGASLTTLWDQTLVELGGSTYDLIYRPSLFVFWASRINLHDIEQIFAEGTPHAQCLVKGTVSADAGADIPVIGTAAVRQAIQIVAHGLDFTAAASCRVRAFATADGHLLAPTEGQADCRAHPFVQASTPADWATPECLRDLPPPAVVVQNYVY